MSTTKHSLERPRVVCQADPSTSAAGIVRAASSYCRRRNAELIIVWILEPSSLRPTGPASTMGTGTWGLAGAVALALGLARREGIAARAVVRIGEADKLLDDERRASGAERVFSHSDGAVEPPIDLVRSVAAKPESEAA